MCFRRSSGAERRRADTGVGGLVVGLTVVATLAAGIGMPRSAAMAQGYGQGGGSRGTGGDFIQRCQERNKSLPQTLGLGVDVGAICSCQAKSLRAKAYDPDAIDDVIRNAYMGAVKDIPPSRMPEGRPHEDSIDPQTRDKLRSGINRIMQDVSAAFQECIRGLAEKNAMQSMTKNMGRGS